MKRLFLLATVIVPTLAFAGTPDVDATKADIKKAFGFSPGFFNGMPDALLPSLWEEMKTLQLNPETKLTGKTKELIGLGVSAQIPCEYCVYAHTKFAKLNGATDAEIAEAVGLASLTRHWSTFINGIQTDEAKFTSEIQTIVKAAKKGMEAGTSPMPVTLTDANSVYRDIEQSFGVVPDFIKRFPKSGVVAAWKGMRDFEMNPKTALENKTKMLIGIGVAAQIPCKYCVDADTQFAKLEGVTDDEIHEAVAVASLIRQMSTMLNGLQVDKVAFKKDVDRIVAGAKKATKKMASVR